MWWNAAASPGSGINHDFLCLLSYSSDLVFWSCSHFHVVTSHHHLVGSIVLRDKLLDAVWLMHHNRNICCVCIGIFDGDETRTVCAACAHPQGACSFQIYDLHILVLGTYNKCCVQSVKVLAKFKHSRVVVETLLICLPQLGNVIGLTWNCMRFSMCFLFLCVSFSFPCRASYLRICVHV